MPEVNTVREFLEFLSTSARHLQNHPDRHYQSIEEAVLRHGRQWIAQRRPKGYAAKLANRMCFKNAFSLVQWGADDLVYVEGYACPPDGIPVLHAWAVDPDGKVIDPTWTQAHVAQADYFGIAFDIEWLIGHMVKTETYGVFGGSYASLAEIIRNGFPPEAFCETWRATQEGE